MEKDTKQLISDVLAQKTSYALLFGDANKVLDNFPKESVNCVVTSPPYWKQREYDVKKRDEDSIIGQEKEPELYVQQLLSVFSKVKEVLKQDGSLWLNLGDKLFNKNLMGMPWRVALALQKDGWILRNDVIWYRQKGTQSSRTRLRSVYEHLFHFVKSQKYYYDYKSILVKPKVVPKEINGVMISATGVSGRRYRSQIANSAVLTENEKRDAFAALDETLEKMRDGKIVDFRMTIRGNQRTLHSNNGNVSGRAKELKEKGFYILKSHADGYMPNDVWSIVPEDEKRDDDEHYAAFPVNLLEIPIKSCCPPNGLVLDPFVGTGTTVIAALELDRRGIGIDISNTYLKIAEKRVKSIRRKLA
ncbi:MAG: site-specific DNA-methyltransferase [Candidatus Burarchaeum sp.]|nr:site-specific DNA-methyltransferase [Candidatus Burarchaeum sp.]MDO8339070.1 site-specific DNA-methyltransferase [Candidatus Burarchaeum sp.]